MSMKQLSISPEINMGDVLHAMIEEFGTGDFIDLIDEIIEEMGDNEFTNELYELLREKHETCLDEMGISEDEYRTDFVHDPSLYPDVEMDDEDEFDEDDEDDDDTWSTNPDSDLGEENPMDVFSTDDK